MLETGAIVLICVLGGVIFLFVIVPLVGMACEAIYNRFFKRNQPDTQPQPQPEPRQPIQVNIQLQNPLQLRTEELMKEKNLNY